MSLTQQDRRAFGRIKVNSAVTLVIDEQQYQVKCKDVTTEGMSLYFSQEIVCVGDLLDVIFDEQDNNFPALHVETEVLRIQQDTIGCLIALEFTAVY